MKKTSAWLEAHPSLGLALAAAATLCGVFLQCPAGGITATLPLGFCLYLAAAFFHRNVIFPPALAAVVALAYGFGLGIASPFAFAGLAALSALAAAGVLAFLRLIRQKKKALFLLPALALLALGAVLSCLFYGTPGAYLTADAEARDYAARRYPDQTFTRISGYRDPVANLRHFDFSYDYEGNTLTSIILFGDTVKDGFLEDRMAFSQEARRSDFIEALRDGEENILVEPDGFSEDLAARDVIPGVYGAYDAALEGDMCFSFTFRKEKTQKRDFALAIRDVLALLSEKGLTCHRLRFVALSSGAPVYECVTAPDTPQEELLDLITRVS